MKILIATTNPGKILEYRQILSVLPIEVVSLKEMGLEHIKVEEDKETFEENAIKKAKTFCEVSKIPVLADDSGLEIDFLSGEPGVKSRRWPGYEASDDELIKLALDKLKGVSKDKRGAQLRCCIAIVFPEEEKIYLTEGILRGIITESSIKIIPGFPFRSIFFLPEINRVLGELTLEEETEVAHRKKAMEKMIPILKEKLVRGEALNQALN